MPPEHQRWAAIAEDLRRYVAPRVSAADVEDVVQDVLVRVVAAKDSLDPERSLAAWVQTVARNAVIDRRRKRTPAVPADEPDAGALDQSIEAESDARRNLLGGWLRRSVERLPEPYREAVFRVDVQEQTQAEVAEALEVPYSTVKSRVQRGRAKLRDMFFACCDAELDARGRVELVGSRDGSCC